MKDSIDVERIIRDLNTLKKQIKDLPRLRRLEQDIRNFVQFKYCEEDNHAWDKIRTLVGYPRSFDPPPEFNWKDE